MKQLDKANLDEWIFDSLEGNLTESEQEVLKTYLSQNPEAKIEYEAWSNTYVSEPEIPFPGEDKLLRNERGVRPLWMKWGLNTLVFILICYLGIKAIGLFNAKNEPREDRVEIPLPPENTSEPKVKSTDEQQPDVAIEELPEPDGDVAEVDGPSSVSAPVVPGQPPKGLKPEITAEPSEPSTGMNDTPKANESVATATANDPPPDITDQIDETSDEDESQETGVAAAQPNDQDTLASIADVAQDNVSSADTAATSDDAMTEPLDIQADVKGASSTPYDISTQTQQTPDDAVVKEGASADNLSIDAITQNDDPVDVVVDTSSTEEPEESPIENLIVSSDSSESPQDSSEVAVVDTTEVVKKKKVKKAKADSSTYPIFSVGPFIGYNSSKYKVVTNNPLGDYAIRVSDLDGVSPFEYSAGINFNFRHSKNFAVEAGVWYSQERTLFLALDTTPGVAFNYSGKYLDIPVRLKYHLQLEKLTFYASAGVLFNFNFPAKTRSTYQHLDYKTTYTVTLMPASAGINAIAALGVQFDLKPKLSMYIEPAYTYSFSPIVKHPTFKDVAVDHYTNTIGIGIGLFYKLNGQ